MSAPSPLEGEFAYVASQSLETLSGGVDATCAHGRIEADVFGGDGAELIPVVIAAEGIETADHTTAWLIIASSRSIVFETVAGAGALK